MIQTRALRYAYPGAAALSFDDVDVPQGATLLLHGASGAGKSTWLALACGLLTPASGEVIVAGQSLAQLSRTGRDAWRSRHLGIRDPFGQLTRPLEVVPDEDDEGEQGEPGHRPRDAAEGALLLRRG